MIKFIKIVALFTLFAVNIFAQTKSNIVTKTLDNNNLPASIKAFIPKGYEALNATIGDLNLDKFADVILVVNKPDEKETSNSDDEVPERPLLILIGEGKDKFKLVSRNDDVVLCVLCGGVFGDPFDGISIKNGVFSVEHYGGSAWRWTRIITFKYSPKDKNWLLTRIGSDSYHTSEPDKVKSDVKTVKNFGRVLFADYKGSEE